MSTEILDHSTDSPSRQRHNEPLGHPFLIVWFGQTVSAIGSAVAGIGLAVYVFLQTDSAAWLGVLSALAAVPFALAGPFMPLVDRISRRRMMIIGDCVAAAGPATALALSFAGALEMWHLAVAVFIGGVGSAFQNPAAQAAVPLLVDRASVDRANGLSQLGPALAMVAGPLVATPLVAWWGIRAVLIVDLVTFAFAVVTVGAVRFHGDLGDDHARTSVTPAGRGWKEATGWLRGEGRPLLALMCAGAVTNFCLSLFNVSLLALATELGGAAKAGIVIAAVGGAAIAGSLIAARRGIPDDRVMVFSGGLGLTAVGCVVAAARPSFAIVMLGAILAVVAIPMVNATSATMFHERVPREIQGRVFGVRGAIGRSLDPVGALVAGFAISRIAEPAMREGGVLAPSLGSFVGSGPGRGPAVVLLVAGLSLGAIAWWLAKSSIRGALRRQDSVAENVSAMM
jgi:DHA3 family macrolide efflux protein-like MFS transporter